MSLSMICRLMQIIADLVHSYTRVHESVDDLPLMQIIADLHMEAAQRDIATPMCMSLPKLCQSKQCNEVLHLKTTRLFSCINAALDRTWRAMEQD